MVKARIRQWLLDHPEVLTLAFVFVLSFNEYAPEEVTTQSGASAYAGP